MLEQLERRKVDRRLQLATYRQGYCVGLRKCLRTFGVSVSLSQLVPAAAAILADARAIRAPALLSASMLLVGLYHS